MVETISEENIEELEGEKVALLDLEGTLTHVKRRVPENADPEHMERILDGEEFDGEVEIGYWTGIHLLAGEPPEDYLVRWRKWKEDTVSTAEFEDENTRQWNELVDESDFESAEEFLEWYNERFLNLRKNAGELIKRLQEAGFKTGLLSHTSTSLCLHAAEKLGADFVVPTWSFNFEDGRFVRADMAKYADEKSHIIGDMDGLEVEKIIFYGNGRNDVRIAEKADRGFLIENKTELDYEAVDAFTGSFEEVMERTDEVLQ